MSKKSQSAKAAAEVLQAEQSNEVAIAASTAFALPSGLKLKKLVTVPSLVLKTPGTGATLRIDSAMRVSKVVDKKDSKREPAIICDVTDLTTGQPFIFLVNAVVRENLMRDYPDDGYVGKTFYIQNLGKRTDSQRYNDFGIAELESEADETNDE